MLLQPCSCNSWNFTLNSHQTQGTCDLTPIGWLPGTQSTFLTLFFRRSFHLRFSGMLLTLFQEFFISGSLGCSQKV